MKENEKKTSVFALIITYNPELQTFRKCLESICNQVSQVLVTDNASTNVLDIEEICAYFPTVLLQKNTENMGLPVNYNVAANRAFEMGYDWLLLMDQDSVLPKGYIEKAKAFFCDKQISIICPIYWDINLEPYDQFEQTKPEEVSSYTEFCISSGSLCRIEYIVQQGGFDEKLFIDYVDWDYCKTCLENGYKILQLNECVMEHQIGKSKRVRLLGTDQIVHNHSLLRKYYFFRNRVYYSRKHGINPVNNPRFFLGTFKHIVLLVYEENTLKKIRIACKGIVDGRKMQLNNHPKE